MQHYLITICKYSTQPYITTTVKPSSNPDAVRIQLYIKRLHYIIKSSDLVTSQDGGRFTESALIRSKFTYRQVITDLGSEIARI